MDKKENRPAASRPFTSALTRGENVAVLLYFPVHILLLPELTYALVYNSIITGSMANLIYYAVGTLYMTALCWGFLRRDYDTLCDRLWRVLIVIFASYALLLCFNFVVGALLMLFPDFANPNNQAVVGAAEEDYGPMAAAAIFLAPIVEEMLFRAGLFGLIRRKSRVLAYIASMLLFSVYHIYGYGVSAPMYLLLILQYLPVSWLLCYCYERTNTIWGNIFLHMLINAVSMNVLTQLG